MADCDICALGRGKGERICAKANPDPSSKGFFWTCTRPAGHTGPHIACGIDHPITDNGTWYDLSNPLFWKDLRVDMQFEHSMWPGGISVITKVSERGVWYKDPSGKLRQMHSGDSTASRPYDKYDFRIFVKKILTVGVDGSSIAPPESCDSIYPPWITA